MLGGGAKCVQLGWVIKLHCLLLVYYLFSKQSGTKSLHEKTTIVCLQKTHISSKSAYLWVPRTTSAWWASKMSASNSVLCAQCSVCETRVARRAERKHTRMWAQEQLQLECQWPLIEVRNLSLSSARCLLRSRCPSFWLLSFIYCISQIWSRTPDTGQGSDNVWDVSGERQRPRGATSKLEFQITLRVPEQWHSCGTKIFDTGSINRATQTSQPLCGFDSRQISSTTSGAGHRLTAVWQTSWGNAAPERRRCYARNRNQAIVEHKFWNMSVPSLVQLNIINVLRICSPEATLANNRFHRNADKLANHLCTSDAAGTSASHDQILESEQNRYTYCTVRGTFDTRERNFILNLCDWLCVEFVTQTDEITGRAHRLVAQWPNEMPSEKAEADAYRTYRLRGCRQGSAVSVHCTRWRGAPRDCFSFTPYGLCSLFNAVWTVCDLIHESACEPWTYLV